MRCRFKRSQVLENFLKNRMLEIAETADIISSEIIVDPTNNEERKEKIKEVLIKKSALRLMLQMTDYYYKRSRGLPL
jgi:hypothetical protein